MSVRFLFLNNRALAYLYSNSNNNNKNNSYNNGPVFRLGRVSLLGQILQFRAAELDAERLQQPVQVVADGVLQVLRKQRLIVESFIDLFIGFVFDIPFPSVLFFALDLQTFARFEEREDDVF